MTPAANTLQFLTVRTVMPVGIAAFSSAKCSDNLNVKSKEKDKKERTAK